MPYIGNTIRAADDYRLIDDISSSFNGSTTSFALQVAGSAPVPFPKSPQQVLISVNGVIQEPDPTGASGFNLVGTNIVFSSAPTNGHAFFGIIYATADYLNAGGNFPSGSLGAPSFTFIGDENTGLYRKSGGSVGFVSDATEIANFDSNGITISSGNIIIPDKIIHNGDTNTAIRFPAADTVSIETAGSERFRIDSSGRLLWGHTSNLTGSTLQWFLGIGGAAADFYVASDNDQPGTLNIHKTRSSTPGGNTILQDGDKIGELRFRGNTGAGYVNGAVVQAVVNGTPGSGNDLPTDLVFRLQPDGTGNTMERLRINSSGNIGIGTSSPSNKLHVHGDAGSPPKIIISEGGAQSAIRATRNSDNNGDLRFQTEIGGSIADRMVINYSGNVGIGTTSPQQRLHLHTASSSAANMVFSNTTTGSGASDGFVVGLDGAERGQIFNQENTDLIFGTNNLERMRIDSSGNVGIGMTPSGMRLDLQSAANDIARFTGINSGGITFRNDTSHEVQIHSGNSDALIFGTNGENERMRIDSSGNILCVANGAQSSLAPFFISVIGKNAINYGGGTNDTACLRIEDKGTNNNYYHGIELRTKRGGDVRMYAHDQGDDTADLVFALDGGSSPAEKIRMPNTGGITFNGDTAAANALDDYEEGTYSPALGANGNISGGNGLGCTYTTQTGYYVKIGSFVFCNGILVWNAKSGTLSNTTVSLTLSIPFAMGGTGNQGAGQLSYNSAIDFNADCRNVHGVGSNSYIYFERVSTGSGKHAGYVNTNNLDSSGQINFAFSYRML